LTQNYVTYKANFESIPMVKVNPEFTNQVAELWAHESIKSD
jgi:hypothetical protein